MSAFFQIESLIRLVLLLICTSTYIRMHFPSLISSRTKGFSSIFYKCSVVGERLSFYVGIFCFFYGMQKLLSIII